MKKQGFQGLDLKKPGTKMKLNPKLGGGSLKTTALGRRLLYLGKTGAETEKICKTQKTVLTEDNKVIKLLHTLQGSRERENR